MKRFFVALLIISSIQLSQTALAQDLLSEGFSRPPAPAKARTWWHWINGNVSREGITADLEAMKRVGIQEAQIFNVDQGYPNGPATFMSPQWLEFFHFAVAEAKRLGLEIGFHNGAGWSSSGGPWIKPENSMQTVVFSEVRVKGGAATRQILPLPKTKLDYYKDIAVIAFPAPKNDTRIDEINIKTLSNDSFKTHLMPDDKPIDNNAIIKKSGIIDLTQKMGADGSLNWKVPEGEWVILRFGHTPTGTENRPAGPGGKGLEVDKMSREALDTYWAGGIQPVLDKLGQLTGQALTNCLIDSYEVGCNNWTSGFQEAFRKRRQYDCTAYLPALAGYYIESGAVTERFLWDFRKTVGDLIADNYYGYFSELCHKNGMKFSVEPYGGPFESLKAGAYGDIPMGEFWVGNNVYLESTKLAASVAHLKGSSIVGAESFTSFGGWLNHPATLKQIGDYVWSEGVNRLIFHTYVHQPWNIAPGLTFHMYGIEMSRLNTWWEQSRAYMDYIGRSQFLLQQGLSSADVLIFAGESSPNDAIIRRDIKNLGYDYDQIGPGQLYTLTVKNGKLLTKSGLAYSILLLPDTKWATPELLVKLRQLIQAGAVISGPKPLYSPSLEGYPGCDQTVKTLAGELWDSGKILPPAPVQDLFKNIGLVQDFSADSNPSDLNFIHRTTGKDDIYFVANARNEKKEAICRFRVTGRKPEFWNAETGRIVDVPVWRKIAGNITEVPISFEANGAVFVVFRSTADPAGPTITQIKTELDHLPLKPLPELKIMKAEYGVFLPEGITDVTAALTARLKKKPGKITADNGLSVSDPAPGSVKTLRLEYLLDGKTQELHLQENQEQVIDTDKSGFRLVRALYGKFPNELKSLPPAYPIFDVTEKVSNLLAANRPVFTVSDSIFKTPVAGSDETRELRIVYSTEGETRRSTTVKGEMVHLETELPQPWLSSKRGRTEWITPFNGKLNYTLASGKNKTLAVDNVPNPVELSGPWTVRFPRAEGTSKQVVFPQLISWARSADSAIRYFSGTAVYEKQFTLSSKLLGKENALELDLGSVRVIAEVKVNGKNLGILWKAPFRIDLGNAVHAGTNTLEIQITNLWPNRLIGDAHLPDDVKGASYGIPESWPDWLQHPETRKSKRTTFTTWKHWDEHGQLQPSGLLGPVVIRPYRRVGIALN